MQKLQQMHMKYTQTVKKRGGRQIADLREKWRKEMFQARFFFTESLQIRLFLWDTVHETENANRHLTKENEDLRSELLKVKGAYKRLADRSSHRGPNSNKQPCSRMQLWRRKRKMRDDIENYVSACSSESCKVSSLELSLPNGKIERIDFANSRLKNGHANNLIDAVLLVKSKCMISDKAYHELSQLFHTLPRLNQMKIRANELSSNSDILFVRNKDEKAVGAGQKVEDSLPAAIRHLVRLGCKEKELVLKISGDGTRTGKHHHVVNMGFSVRPKNRELLAASPEFFVERLHLIASAEVSENREDLVSLFDQFLDIEKLELFEVDGVEYSIQIILAGDLKFLAICLGIAAANSEYACPWCTCPRAKRWNMSLSFSMIDEAKGARTVESITNLSTKPGISNRQNCKYPPILPRIPVHCVTPDSLHLFLRVSDMLLDKFFRALRSLDGMPCSPEDSNRVERFIQRVSELGVPLSWYESKDGAHSFSSLNVAQRKAILGSIDVCSFLPPDHKPLEVLRLWRSLPGIIDRMNSGVEDLLLLDSDCKEWVTLFGETYLKRDTTPYMHILGFHVTETMRLHGPMRFYSQQRLEYLNHETTQAFYRATNHRAGEAHVQAIKRDIRMLKLHMNQRKKRNYRCSLCKKPDHTKRVCPDNVTRIRAALVSNNRCAVNL